jgi:hypothetical protein
LKSVVFPEPFGPNNPHNCPGSTEKETSDNIGFCVYRNERSEIRNMIITPEYFFLYF